MYFLSNDLLHCLFNFLVVYIEILLAQGLFYAALLWHLVVMLVVVMFCHNDIFF